MFGNEAIKAEWFLEGKKEKTKLNWFTYEVALEYHYYIMKHPALVKFRKECGEEAIAQFCADYAKQMKQSVLEKLAGITEAVELDEEYISQYFPRNSTKQNRMLVEGAFASWDSLLSVCETCPTRCISEKERYCDLFDTY